MSLIFNLFSILLVSLGALVVIVSNSAPTGGISIINVEFFLFILLFTYSASYLIYLLLAKRIGLPNRLLNRRILLFSLLVSGLIVMSSLQVLNAISTVSFLLSIILLELFFMSQTRNE